MAQDKELTYKRLSSLWGNDEVPVLDTAGGKYVIISDLHMGDGGDADNFRNNKKTLVRALDHYHREGYRLILLGDIEELWQFDLSEISKEYDAEIYERVRAFGDDNIYRVFGNHDIDWSLKDPIRTEHQNGTRLTEALKMKDKQGNISVFLVHGHQGSIESDKNSWFSRFVVRGLWTPLEPLAIALGLYGNTSATKSQVTTDYERILYSWAKENKVILICGHSHRAIYASKSYLDRLKNEIAQLQLDILGHRTDKKRIEADIKQIEKLQDKLLEEKLKGRDIDPTEPNKKPLPCYFNSGCGLYSDGITVIEIADDTIQLVKWHRAPRNGYQSEIYDNGSGKTLSDFIGAVRDQVVA